MGKAEKPKRNICPNCGGRIYAEALGTYGTIYNLRRDGSVGCEIRNVKYGYNGDWLFYCTKCGTNFEEKEITGEKDPYND